MRILIVDDEARNRALLAAHLAPLGHELAEAEDGLSALADLEAHPADLVLLDFRMPGIDGIDVLHHLRARPELVHMPVVLVTAMRERSVHLNGLEAGADEFLEKPVDPAILRARVRNLLLLRAERARSQQLLLNVLPQSVADRLMRGEQVADQYDDVTVLFADIVGFTAFSATRPPSDTVALLNTVFSRFDVLADRYGLEKIKTIGDAYLAVAGLGGQPTHPSAAVAMALEMLHALDGIAASPTLRIGVHTGPVVAGVLGTRKFSYDVWGDTVNVASRMESTGLPGRVQVTDTTRGRLGDTYLFEERPHVLVKGKGEMRTWLVLGPKVSQGNGVEAR